MLVGYPSLIDVMKVGKAAISMIRAAHTTCRDPVEAVRDFHEQVAQPDMALVLFFCSSRYDLDRIGAELQALFGSVPVAGCTTAGEIGPGGYRDHSISGLSFPSDSFSVSAELLGPLETLEVSDAQHAAARLKCRMPEASPGGGSNPFAFLMVDGLSRREEPLIAAAHNALGAIPIIGGSAADDLHFSETWVYFNGRFLSDHAVLLLLDSDCPVTTVRSQHFVATDRRMVITGADPLRRCVTEINGLPAAREYARLIGADLEELNLDRFAFSPVVVMVNGEEYVRSIQRANADGSLTFHCAIEEGLVIRIAEGVDLRENLKKDLAAVADRIGPPQVILGCDCVLRNRELTHGALKEAVGTLMEENLVVGFSSYGEQYGSVHVNQTFTALAIGQPGGCQP